MTSSKSNGTSSKSNGNSSKPPGQFRCAVLGMVKHMYIPRGMFAHPRFAPVVVADHADQPDWVHERNEKYAAEVNVPYVKDVERAIREFDAQVAIISSEAERHCDLSGRAAEAGLHVIQDKPMSTQLAECDRVVEIVERKRVKFMMWNRNCLPAIMQAEELVRQGAIGKLQAIHVDFYFAKDAGPKIGSRRPGDPPLDWQEALKAAHVTGADGGVGKNPMGELEVEGIYPLGYIDFLHKSRVRRVFARTTAHFHQLQLDNDVDDLASVTLEMEDGVLATLCMGRIGNASHPDIGEIKMHLLGTEGGLVITEARPELAVYYRGQPDTEFRHVRVASDLDWHLAESFARAIDTDGETVLDARTSRAICATVLAAIESGRTGLPVHVAHLED